MSRYGWDYDRGYRGWDRGPSGSGSYDRGYRYGWGMSGLNNAFIRGPRPEVRGYDPPFRGRPRYRGYDREIDRYGSWAPWGRPFPNQWRGGYDRGW